MKENDKTNILNQKSKINNNIIDDDTTFNKLKDLQKLIKKESAIKKLFIKMKNETKNSIERQCVDVYKKKMEVFARNVGKSRDYFFSVNFSTRSFRSRACAESSSLAAAVSSLAALLLCTTSVIRRIPSLTCAMDSA